MPVETRPLYTAEVCSLVLYFLEKAKKGGHFTRYQRYDQENINFHSFGGSCVIAFAERPYPQAPLLVGCAGFPMSASNHPQSAEHAKLIQEEHNISSYLQPVLEEWIRIRYLSKNKDVSALNVKLHICWATGKNHWQSYLFDFSDANPEIIEQLIKLNGACLEFEANKPRRLDGTVDEKRYTDEVAIRASKKKELLGALYKTVTVSYTDPKHWPIPEIVIKDLSAFFGKHLDLPRLRTPFQPNRDQYTCGDRIARDVVGSAFTGGLDYSHSTSEALRYETMAVLTSLADPWVLTIPQFSIFYSLLRLIAFSIACVALNYFLATSVIALLGGVLGICLITMTAFLLCEIILWEIQAKMASTEAIKYAKAQVEVATVKIDVSPSQEIKQALTRPLPAYLPVAVVPESEEGSTALATQTLTYRKR